MESHGNMDNGRVGQAESSHSQAVVQREFLQAASHILQLRFKMCLIFMMMIRAAAAALHRVKHGSRRSAANPVSPG